VSHDAWSGERGALPRVDDLPAAEHGYERESVQRAFDAFYRHIAQLDSTLKTLEAVETFQRQAGELRSELRSLRSAGWTQQPWTSSYSFGGEPRVRTLVPPALPRIATEVAFLVAVAVIVGVGHFSAWLIVVVMAAAWAIVGAIEWFASRERLPGPVTATAPALLEEPVAAAPAAAPAPEEPAQVYGWPDQEPEGDAAGDVEVEPESEAVEAAPQPEADGASASVAEEAEEEPEPAPVAAAATPEEPDEEGERRRWFGRRRRAEPERVEPEPRYHEPPSHVRILGAADDDEDTGEDVTRAVSGDPQRRFRRR
jgi:hypothetical protein